uniref:Retrotransposon protein, putative, Ty3-gypsy subclass n=1 Tax=Oryza sativa subsp. japonica TaxID=39947 RepID=Q2QSL5_ORYSJ|nr:retrotransposon protein, putative, Ty3-gypsy subclass [Oryza sativa Japonica Group]
MARARSAERGGSDPVGRPPAAAARREDAREVADEGEKKREEGECSPRCTTAKGRPTARNGGGGAPQVDDATELRRRASLGMGRTGSASIGDRGRRSSGGFLAKRGGGQGPPRPCGAEGGNGAGRRRPKWRRDAAGVGGDGGERWFAWLRRYGGGEGKWSGGRACPSGGNAGGGGGAARRRRRRLRHAAGERRRAAAMGTGVGRAGKSAGSSGWSGKRKRGARGCFI